MQYKALQWLYKQLKDKRIALGKTDKKPNHTEKEINDIQTAIDTIEYIIGVVTAKGEA